MKRQDEDGAGGVRVRQAGTMNGESFDVTHECARQRLWLGLARYTHSQANHGWTMEQEQIRHVSSSDVAVAAVTINSQQREQCEARGVECRQQELGGAMVV